MSSVWCRGFATSPECSKIEGPFLKPDDLGAIRASGTTPENFTLVYGWFTEGFETLDLKEAMITAIAAVCVASSANAAMNRIEKVNN
jgi:hypothetical protein